MQQAVEEDDNDFLAGTKKTTVKQKSSFPSVASFSNSRANKRAAFNDKPDPKKTVLNLNELEL